MDFHPSARARLVKKLWLFLVLAVAVGGIVWWRDGQGGSKDAQPATSSSAVNVKTEPAAVFNKNQYSVNDPGSLWVVVNKGRILPSDYSPGVVLPNTPIYYGTGSDDSHLRKDAATALEQLFNAAESSGYMLRLYSGYRSYNEQVSVYNGFVAHDGQAKTDTYSARPGHSEHQTGLAADISATSGKCDLQQCFGDMLEGKWLAANAGRYGFILRYPLDKDSITGYHYEPWHLRYVGVELAAELNKTGQTLEQFFDLPAYPNYPVQSYELKSGT